MDDAVEWAYAVLKSIKLEDLRAHVKEYGDVTIPDLASNQIRTSTRWIGDRGDRWATELRERFDLLTSTCSSTSASPPC